MNISTNYSVSKYRYYKEIQIYLHTRKFNVRYSNLSSKMEFTCKTNLTQKKEPQPILKLRAVAIAD